VLKPNRTVAGFIAGFAMLMLLVSAAVAEMQWGGFGFEDKGDAKAVKVKIPAVKLTEAEKKDLYDGKPITRLLPSPDGLKIGYMRFFAPFDPVTSWMITTDGEHLDLEDPSYPKSGSFTSKKRTFMPYVFDCATCKEGGRDKMFQLLVMPLVKPRKLCINRLHDVSAFPWETAWTLSEGMCCQSGAKPEMKKYADDAVTLKKNTGAWHIGPLPKEFRKTDADIMRTDFIYYVDTNPGGDLSKLKAIVNKATSIALPALQENVLFHGKTWKAHLAKHHGAAEVAKYKGWVADYTKAMTGE
jgi:hypothetical protein